jgi:hypothetical protein
MRTTTTSATASSDGPGVSGVVRQPAMRYQAETSWTLVRPVGETTDQHDAAWQQFGWNLRPTMSRLDLKIHTVLRMAV